MDDRPPATAADTVPAPFSAVSPRSAARGPSRRRFLQGAALLAAGAPSLSALLAACSTPDVASAAASITLAAPDHPVTWDIAKDNQPIADGLAPEKGATLQLYNYADYISPDAVASFEKKYSCKVQVSTFNDTDEAITKIRAGNVPYDIYFPSYDQISRLVAASLVRPLNHSYIGGISNVWSSFTDPWYDGGWRYTVPYTVYTTGIGWRADEVSTDVASMSNPYDVLWDPQWKGRTAVIDDFHTAMGMVLLRQGITDINTSSASDLKVVGDQLSAMVKATAPKVTITMYNDLPAGQLGVCQMWSGDMINAQSYLASGVSVDQLRYWFPADGKGMVDNDLMVVLRSGKNPVLAHLFLNHMLDPDVAKENYGAIGYQPPQVSIQPDSLVADGFIPENLKSAVVQQSYFDEGYRLLELSTANDAAWHDVWRAFKAGG